METSKAELENDPLIKLFKLNTKATVFNQLLYPAMGVIIGVGAFVIRNFGYNRPLYAGIQRHIAGGLAGGYLGFLAEGRNQQKSAERDASIRHYMSLHPEDFAPKEKVFYKDIIMPWTPIR